MALPGTRKNAFPHQIPINLHYSMPRTKGAIDLSEVKRGALIELKKENNTFNPQIAREYECGKLIVANILKRAEEAAKENIDSLSLEAYQ